MAALGLAVKDLAFVFLVRPHVYDLIVGVIGGQGVGVDQVGLVNGLDGDFSGGVGGGPLYDGRAGGYQGVIAPVHHLHVGEPGGHQLPQDAAVVAPAVLGGGEEDDLLIRADAGGAQGFAQGGGLQHLSLIHI